MTKELYQDFKQAAEAVSAEVYRVKTGEEALTLMSELLQKWEEKRKPQGLEIVWQRGPILETEEGVISVKGKVYEEELASRAPEADVGITEADLAIAETGTLVQNATDVTKRYITTLPELNILLVKTDSLVATMDDAFSAMKPADFPFYALITGPSRTADIERVLTLGVHGPEWLWVIFVDGEGE